MENGEYILEEIERNFFYYILEDRDLINKYVSMGEDEIEKEEMRDKRESKIVEIERIVLMRIKREYKIEEENIEDYKKEFIKKILLEILNESIECVI